MKSLRRGFTLIELLVVIAIIAILAAILFPVLAQARAAAKKAVSLSNCKQQGLGMAMYATDSDDIMPLAFHPSDGSAYSWNRFIPVPSSQLGAAEPGWKVDAAKTFVFNSMQPYMKNVDILQCPNGSRLNTSGFYGPSTAQPSGLPSVTYTYNGYLNGYSQSAIAAPSSLATFWHGHGKRSLYGYGYASPWLVCNNNTQPCTYQPPVSGCGSSAANGAFGAYTSNTSSFGMDVFNRGIILTMADSSAKFRRLGMSGTYNAAQRNDPRVDPFPHYGRNGIPCGRYFDQFGCHAYMFRPDYDFQTAEPAIYLAQTTTSQMVFCQ